MLPGEVAMAMATIRMAMETGSEPYWLWRCGRCRRPAGYLLAADQFRLQQAPERLNEDLPAQGR
jgi:hypothetical protein